MISNLKLSNKAFFYFSFKKKLIKDIISLVIYSPSERTFLRMRIIKHVISDKLYRKRFSWFLNRPNRMKNKHKNKVGVYYKTFQLDKSQKTPVGRQEKSLIWHEINLYVNDFIRGYILLFFCCFSSYIKQIIKSKYITVHLCLLALNIMEKLIEKWSKNEEILVVWIIH